MMGCLVKNELWQVWKEAVGSCFGTIQAIPWYDRARPKHTSERTVGFWAEIWNSGLPNVKQDCIPLNHKVWHIDHSYRSKGPDDKFCGSTVNLQPTRNAPQVSDINHTQDLPILIFIFVFFFRNLYAFKQGS